MANSKIDYFKRIIENDSFNYYTNDKYKDLVLDILNSWENDINYYHNELDSLNSEVQRLERKL